MKVAVTAQGTRLDSMLDPRFGRAKCFIVVDTETGRFEGGRQQCQPGCRAGSGHTGRPEGRRVRGRRADYREHVGPKAFTTLKAGRVQIYTGAAGTVAEAIEQCKAGNLTVLKSADENGHWQ